MGKKEFDIISIGDVTIDHFIIFHDAVVNCQIKPEICQLCINYADKLPVDRYITTVAGNAANNAVGSSRLGMKTAIYAVVGNDEPGRRIKDKLLNEGVDVRFLNIKDGDETNNSFVLSYQGERTIMVYHVKHAYNVPDFPEASWIYLTSTGHGYETLFEKVVAYVKKSGAKLAYNPGTFQLRGDEALMAEVLKNSEIVFVNVEEAQSILGTKDRNIKSLLAKMRELGPGIAVITDGVKGSYTYDGEHYLQIGQFTPKTVESTGAGDGYATGFVAAVSYGESVSEAMRWGGINGNSVVQKIGPQAGLLTKSSMDQRLKANPDYLPKLLE